MCVRCVCVLCVYIYVYVSVWVYVSVCSVVYCILTRDVSLGIITVLQYPSGIATHTHTHVCTKHICMHISPACLNRPVPRHVRSLHAPILHQYMHTLIYIYIYIYIYIQHTLVMLPLVTLTLLTHSSCITTGICMYVCMCMYVFSIPGQSYRSPPSHS